MQMWWISCFGFDAFSFLHFWQWTVAGVPLPPHQPFPSPFLKGLCCHCNPGSGGWPRTWRGTAAGPGGLHCQAGGGSGAGGAGWLPRGPSLLLAGRVGVELLREVDHLYPAPQNQLQTRPPPSPVSIILRWLTPTVSSGGNTLGWGAVLLLVTSRW